MCLLRLQTVLHVFTEQTAHSKSPPGHSEAGNERGITPPACGSNGYCLLFGLIREAPLYSSDAHIGKVQSQATQQSNSAPKHPSFSGMPI